ncbi:SIS domain-containing protein [Telmatospirillum sp.]|uniref:SIS domain-containing protein n=1 Tax=Telmatospirillum sp. TaxID=2079197 RepID=UPI00284EAF31|nr:SIS domain-containing protein [Telmatospirillum sp.]MDR3436215.1 SIS domain-containing protein [Telmatospirillum sp.]
MNSTERVIVEQFPYWENALDLALPAADGDTLVFVGCGTSYYIALTLAAAANLNGHRAIAVPGSEWTLRPKAYLPDLAGAVVVGVSRSGESTEVVSAVTVSHGLGLPTVAITCEKDSAIARAADRLIFTATHPEEGIVMSASASLMLLMGLRWVGEPVDRAVVAAARDNLQLMGAKAPALIAGRTKFVTLGSGAYYGIACEGALKLQEMSISVSQPFHTMEYRHGPISLADQTMLAVVLYGEDAPDEDARLVAELQATGARVIGIGGPGNLTLPIATRGLQRTLEMLPALQILGERIALAKNIDSTAPRNLTKVVRLA